MFRLCSSDLSRPLLLTQRVRATPTDRSLANVNSGDKTSGSADWTWFDDLNPEALRLAGEATVKLLETAHRWVHRRVERVEFVNHSVARHRISVDFTLPEGVNPVATLHGKDVYVVPLFMLEKPATEPVSRDDAPGVPADQAFIAPYSNIDIRDARHGVLSLNTHAQNANLGGQVLSILADRAVGDKAKIDENLRRMISGIAIRGSRSDAADLGHVLHPTEKLASNDPRHHLIGCGQFTEFAHALATHDLVAAWFIGDLPPRSVVKIAFDEQMQTHPLKLHERIRRDIGWKSARYHINLTEIGAAASYHVEVSLPPELELNEIGLLGEHYEYGWQGLPTPGKQRQLRDSASSDDVLDPDGFFVRRAEKDQLGTIYLRNPDTRRVGTAWVKVRARRHGFLSGAIVASILTTGILALYAFHASELVKSAAASSSSEILLVLPAVLAAYIARPDDHVMTSYLLRGARYVLVLDGCLPVLAALRLLTLSQHDKHPAHTLLAALIPLTILSALSVLIFALSLVFPRPHEKQRYVVRSMPGPLSGAAKPTR